jgi:Pyruvate/2-oxoacid:ferredoxin oxidoreductase gamma subunit
VDAQKWVEEHMTRVFPLGVKKELAAEPWPAWKRPSFDPARLQAAVNASDALAPRFGARFPGERYGDDAGLKLAGAGGDGAQTAAMLVARAAINEGFDATHIPSYGPESRGGTSYADVRIAPHEVLSPAVPEPHALVAFNAPSLARFGPAVVPGGVVVYDSSVCPDPPALAPGVRMVAVPCTRIAQDLGRGMVKNVVALGALHEATRLLPVEAYLAALREALREKADAIPVNEQAFTRGMEMARNAEEVSCAG